MTLTIPPNALSGTAQITITRITNQSPGGLGDGYRLGPDGQTFNSPVQIVFKYDDQDLAGTAPASLSVAYQDTQHFWHALKSVNLNQGARTLTVSTMHFSDWSRISGFQLLPAAARVRIGNAGGNATTGTVAATGDFGATFTAPAAKPSPNVVAVSAQLDGALGTFLLVSNITIDEDTWTGTGSSSSAAVTATAQVVWTLESTENNVGTYRATGTASAAIAGCAISPNHSDIIPSSGVLYVDYNVNPPTYHGSGTTVWQATWSCPNLPPFSNGVVAGYFGGNSGLLGVEAQGVVSADGITIEGTAINMSGPQPVTFNWKFTRTQ